MSSAGDWLRFAIALSLFGALVWLLLRPRRHEDELVQVDDEPEGTPYRVYTYEFDQIVRGRDLPTFAEDVDRRRGRGVPNGLAPWPARVRLASTIAETQKDDWMPAAEALDASLQRLDQPTAIMLLIDHSGSMRDRMMSVAATVRWFADIADQRGIALAISGFTTVDWRGGDARLAWIEARRPARPGRLCDILYVRYQDFGEALSDADWRAMLHPQILRENIDGEAIEWAAGLLAARSEPIKLLIVLSDGAPVDDSTLYENGPSFLVRHIHGVIDAIEGGNEISLGAVGVGYGVHEYYSVSAEATELAQLPAALASVIGKLIKGLP